MSDHIVGVMWAKNEADIIMETIEDALNHVDTMMIADDGSTDDTWDMIVEMAQLFPQIELIQQKPDKNDKGQRAALLNAVRQRYRPEDTWVQVIEADIFLLDSDLRAICQAATKVGISWQTLNAVRAPGTWQDADSYPAWHVPIREVMPLAHRMEVMLYTFRPLPDLYYERDNWRPWPKGFGKYGSSPLKTYEKRDDSPLLLHVGHRGPTHFHKKYQHMGLQHTRYPNWNLTCPRTVEQTVSFFNGEWNGKAFEASRRGWSNWIKSLRGE